MSEDNNLGDYLGGFDMFTTGGGLGSKEIWMAVIVVLVIYVLALLWKNKALLSGAKEHWCWNPFAAKDNSTFVVTKVPGKEGYDGVPFDYGMRMRSSLTSGDQVGTGQALQGDMGSLSPTQRINERFWAPQERMTLNKFGAREGMFGGNGEAPTFNEPNPYLTQAKEWGVPDLSRKFSNADPLSRVYYGGERDKAGNYQVQTEGMTATEDQLYSVLNGM